MFFWRGQNTTVFLMIQILFKKWKLTEQIFFFVIYIYRSWGKAFLTKQNIVFKSVGILLASFCRNYVGRIRKNLRFRKWSKTMVIARYRYVLLCGISSIWWFKKNKLPKLVKWYLAVFRISSRFIRSWIQPKIWIWIRIQPKFWMQIRIHPEPHQIIWFCITWKWC